MYSRANGPGAGASPRRCLRDLFTHADNEGVALEEQVHLALRDHQDAVGACRLTSRYCAAPFAHAAVNQREYSDQDAQTAI